MAASVNAPLNYLNCIYYYNTDDNARFFYFVFENTSDSLPMWLVTTVIPVGTHSTSRSHMFYKIHALKTLVIFTEKHPCWRFFLIDFIKNILQHSYFPRNLPNV